MLFYSGETPPRGGDIPFFAGHNNVIVIGARKTCVCTTNTPFRRRQWKASKQITFVTGWGCNKHLAAINIKFAILARDYRLVVVARHNNGQLVTLPGTAPSKCKALLMYLPAQAGNYGEILQRIQYIANCSVIVIGPITNPPLPAKGIC